MTPSKLALPVLALLVAMAAGCSGSGSGTGTPMGSGTGSGSPPLPSSGSGSGSASGSGTGRDSGVPIASAYITSTLGPDPTPGTASTCTIDPTDTVFLTVGNLENPLPSGSSSNGNPVEVACSVKAAATAGAYAVSLTVSAGAVGVTMSGTLTSPSGGSLDASFMTPDMGSYLSNATSDCTVTLSTEATPAITAGRVWATMTCPTLVDPETSTTCYGTATFLFENCVE